MQDTTDQGKQSHLLGLFFGCGCTDRPIQCDETKPQCLRCRKSGRLCLRTSVIEQPGFSINIENSYASGKVKRPRGPRSSLTLLRPQFDLEARAVASFLQNYELALTDIPDVAQTLCGSVAAWRASGRKSAMVDLALSSTSLAVFSRTHQVSQAAIDAASRYCRLLRTVQDRISNLTLSDPDDGDSIDAYLLTMFLMGRYEATMHNHGTPVSNNPSAWLHRWFHHEGALTVLKLWAENPSPSGATFIMKLGRRTLIKTSLLRRHSPLPDWISDGGRFGEHGLELGYDRILVGIVKLHQESGTLRQRQNVKRAELSKLYGKGGELDDALRDWADRLPRAWNYQQHALTEPGPWPRRNFYSQTVYTFATPGYALVWGQYFATRMLINSIRLRILDLSFGGASHRFDQKEQQWRECSDLVNSMADSLASTIPFSLERIKVSNDGDMSSSQAFVTTDSDEEAKLHLAGLVAWQLTIASSLEGTNVTRHQWFISELAHLGRKMGNGILESAENGEWPML